MVPHSSDYFFIISVQSIYYFLAFFSSTLFVSISLYILLISCVISLTIKSNLIIRTRSYRTTPNNVFYAYFSFFPKYQKTIYVNSARHFYSVIHLISDFFQVCIQITSDHNKTPAFLYFRTYFFFPSSYRIHSNIFNITALLSILKPSLSISENDSKYRKKNWIVIRLSICLSVTFCCLCLAPDSNRPWDVQMEEDNTIIALASRRELFTPKASWA